MVHPATMVRPAAVAGLFYDDDAETLAAHVDRLLADAKDAARPSTSLRPKALVVPHAGYIYSGPVAASAYHLLAEHPPPQRVVLIGPTHRVALRGVALPEANAFDTPLGELPICPELLTRLSDLPRLAAPHAKEHALEVQLPFLLRLYGSIPILPLAVGDASPEEVAVILDRVWGDDDTLLLISTDLSHFHGYDEARSIDRETAQRILAQDPTIHPKQACGARGLNGFLLASRRRGLTAQMLDLRNSGDTRGSRNEVVGYAAFRFDGARAGAKQ